MAPPVPPNHHAPVQPQVNSAYYSALYQGVHPGLYPAAHPTAHQQAHPLAHPAAHPATRPATHQGGHPASHPTGHPMGHPAGHPGVHPSGAARAIHTPTPDPLSPTKLTERIARLNVNTERQIPGNPQRVPDSTPAEKTDSRAPFYYIGYTFFKADAIPGHKSTWTNIDRTQINLTQTELLDLVQKRAKKLPGVEQYQSLSKLKRTHVDSLISELKKSDPRFEWTCAYVKEEERPMKGKNNKRGDYQTISMDVVIMGKAIASPRPKTPHGVQVTFETPDKPKERPEPKVDTPVVNNDPRPMDRNIENNVQWAAQPSLGQAQQPPMVHNIHQQLPPQFQHQVPPPPPHPSQGHPSGGRQFINQPHLPQGAPATSVPGAFPQSDMPHPARAAQGKGSAIEILQDHVRGVPVGAAVNHLRQGINSTHNPVAGMPMNNPRKETFPSPEDVNQRGSVKPPNLRTEPEPEWNPESSSIGDDESEIFDFDDLSSVTDDSEDDGETREDPQPWRGSLFRRDSSHTRRPGLSRYRSHYRKQPTGATDSKNGRAKYPNGYVDVIPADSRDSDKQLWRLHSREVTRQTRDRPKIIHAPVSSDDLNLAERSNDRYRGLRARNDIRSRILDDREARVERREKLVDYRNRMLDERLDEAYLGRRMSLRDPGPYYPRQYFGHDTFH
ncbi:hypothetical protein BBP40_004954 [Aspergillus hancockii]|nr:hypothetical protein BBP40_004954 [Aspergillus hancockii]